MRRLVKTLLLIALVPVLGISDGPETYSDVREVEESGDLVGTEVALEIAGEGVTGTLRHYEGADPEPIMLTGRLTAGELTLIGSYSEGKVRITARLANDRITGTLTFQIDGQVNEVPLNLPRVERARAETASISSASCHR